MKTTQQWLKAVTDKAEAGGSWLFWGTLTRPSFWRRGVSWLKRGGGAIG